MMSIFRKVMAMAAMLAACGATSTAAARTGAGQTIAIVGAAILPMTGRDRLNDQIVIIRGDHILAVGPRARIKLPAGARIVDGRGQVLLPGLVDMHVHLAPVEGQDGDAAQRALAVMLAHGVTTVRGMAGSAANLVVRDKIERGTLAGPRLYAASPALNVKSVTSPAGGRRAVQQARAAGYDLVKAHHLTDITTWQAIQDEARKVGLPTAGHVTHQVGIDRAVAAGQQIEHLDGMIAALLPPQSAESAIEFGQIPPPEVLAVAARATDAEIDALARRLAAAKSWHVPTLGLFEKIADPTATTAQLAADPAMRFIPDAALAQWAAQRDEFAKAGMTPADGTRFRELRRRIVGALHRAGVPLMAGSDTAQAFHVWGPAIHTEIEALVAAGLSPLDALRSATVVPRNYFRSLPNGGSARGWRADFGTVEAGARADLILLARDPSKDLTALRRPTMVIAGGRLFDRRTLDAMLAKAAVDAKAIPVPAAATVPTKPTNRAAG